MEKIHLPVDGFYPSTRKRSEKGLKKSISKKMDFIYLPVDGFYPSTTKVLSKDLNMEPQLFSRKYFWYFCTTYNYGYFLQIFFCILQSVRFSMTVRTDIFLYTEKLSYAIQNNNYTCLFQVYLLVGLEPNGKHIINGFALLSRIQGRIKQEIKTHIQIHFILSHR